MIKRRTTKKIPVRDKFIGGDSPILIQSMTNTPTKDVEATINQINRLEEAGCELVRLGIPDMESAQALGKIIKSTALPVAADIHFNADLAREAIRQGVHKLRINPGNLVDKKEVRDIVIKAKDAGIPIRIGVNAGSLSHSVMRKYGNRVCAEAMVDSCLEEISLLENEEFKDIIVSLKASSVSMCVEAYRMISQRINYPLHIGITEAGLREYGTIKSSIGMGILLYDGIGDTMRVSLTDDPVYEIAVAWDILKALEIRRRDPEIISCPTCARSEINVISLAGKISNEIKHLRYPIQIAVMGCSVNGPGEAKEADLGIAGGKGNAVIFREGSTIIKDIREEDMLRLFMEEIEKYIKEKY